MYDSLLRGPHDPLWQLEPDYSWSVATLLDAADKQLAIARATGDPNDYEPVIVYAQACVEQSHSLRQAVRAGYLVGNALAGMEDFADALECFDEALDGAARLGDWSAYVALTQHAGWASGQLYQYQSAAHYTALALRQLDAHANDRGVIVDPQAELDVIAAHASFQFMLGQFPSAVSALTRARVRAALTPATPLHQMTVDWIEALLQRWRGEPARALALAQRAADTLASSATLARDVLSLGRIRGIVAEIALDLAERYPIAVDEHTRYVRLARRGLRDLSQIASGAGDDAGRVLATLGRARLDRVTNRNVDRTRALERALRRARDLGDTALVTQALTALGHEFAARGESESARTCYRRALAQVDGTDLRAMGIFPRRALLQAEEWES
jgi:tetratricopeptide (TPR) repeat protein